MDAPMERVATGRRSTRVFLRGVGDPFFTQKKGP